MRILYWNPLYWPQIGGMERAGATLTQALRARGHTVDVVTSHDVLELPDEQTHDGIVIHRFPFRQALTSRDPFLMLSAQRGVAALKRELRPDVVHINLPDPAALVHLRTVDAHPSALVVTIHASIDLDSASSDTLFAALLRSAGWVTAPSNAILGPLRRAMPALDGRSSVVHYGLEPSPPPQPLPADPRVLCTGRFIREKGFDLAIAAFASIADRVPTARLVLVGDGPERVALERQARDLGLAERTDFLGWILPEAMDDVFASATVVIIPSRWQDAFPVVALEAARAGRPVIAARVGGLPESVVHGRTGFVVDAEDSAAIASAAATLLTDGDLAASMARAAYDRAADAFGMECYADTYEGIYASCAAHAAVGAVASTRDSH